MPRAYYKTMPISCAEKSRGSVCGAKGSDRENMLREGDVRMVDDHGGIGNVGTPSDNRMPRDVRITCNESNTRDMRGTPDLGVVGDVGVTLYMSVIHHRGRATDLGTPSHRSVAKNLSVVRYSSPSENMGVIKNSGVTVDFCRPINGSVAKDSSGTPDLSAPGYDG